MLLPVIALLLAQAEGEAQGPRVHAELERRCQNPDHPDALVCDDVDGEELNLDYPTEARPETPEARTASRLHADLGGGALLTPGAAVELGPQIALGKPLFLFTRHRHFQGLIDTRFALLFGVPARHVGLTLSPMMGINWYFGTRVGLEVRAGVGFGADLHPQVSRFGFSVALSGAIVVRPFADDRMRLKLGVNEDVHYLLSAGSLILAGGIGGSLGFEMPLPGG